MSTVVPIMIILGLGAGSAWVLRRRVRPGWLQALAGAGLATLIWLAGCYLLFVTTAPSELGPPELAPFVYVFLTALVPSALVAWLQSGASGGTGEETGPGSGGDHAATS
jgi:hypothetical protein